MKIQDFCRNYNLDLIPVSDSSIILGDKVRKSIFGKIDFTMQNVIYDLLSAGIISEQEKDDLIKRLKAVKLNDAEMAHIRVRNRVSHKDDLFIPGLIKLDIDFQADKDLHYEFSDLKTRVLRDDLRYDIDSALDELREKHWKIYKKEMRNIYIIERLVYGKVNIIVDKTLEVQLESALKKLNPGATLKDRHKLSKKVSFEIINNELPFAMELVKGRSFDS